MLLLLLFYPSTWYICDFFLFHIEIEGKGGWIIGGAKGYVGPPPKLLGGGPGPLPPPPPPAPLFLLRLCKQYLWFLLFFISEKVSHFLSFQIKMKAPAIILILVVLLLVTGLEGFRRRCFIPRRGPRRGQCVDRKPHRHSTGLCAQIGNSCQIFGGRCRCTRGGVFMHPTDESSHDDRVES